MFRMLVTLSVRNFPMFESYEQQAANIMRAHGGYIIKAYETERRDDDSGEEMHLVEFPDEVSFHAYLKDHRLKDLASLRELAITHTDVKLVVREKDYD